MSGTVRGTRYAIARTQAACAACGRLTALFALLLPPGHEVLDWDEAGPGEVWNVAEHGALPFYVNQLSDTVVCRLRRFAPAYRLGRDDLAVDCYWANHCEHCDAQWPDHDLFCEPGPFLPMNDAQARLIELLPIEDVIAAGAAGYAYEPEFFPRDPGRVFA